MSVEALECPNCGGPLEHGARGCAFCGVNVVGTGEEAAPVRPPEASRVDKLARHLAERGTLNDVWTVAANAWERYRRDGEDALSKDDAYACEVLMAVIGVALLAAQGADRAALPAALSKLSGTLSTDDAQSVLDACQQYLDDAGLDAAVGAAAELLADADLVEEGYALAAGITILGGSIARGEAKRLDDIGAAFELSGEKAKEIRKRTAEAMR